MFLAVGVREDSDLRSSGPLFFLATDEIADIPFAAAFEKTQLFFQKLLEGFITRKEEICALVLDFLENLPADMKRFLVFEELTGTSSSEMGSKFENNQIQIVQARYGRNYGFDEIDAKS